jgi:hypothetical protein
MLVLAAFERDGKMKINEDKDKRFSFKRIAAPKKTQQRWLSVSSMLPLVQD